MKVTDQTSVVVQLIVNQGRTDIRPKSCGDVWMNNEYKSLCNVVNS